jgi:hypothetical protein
MNVASNPDTRSLGATIARCFKETLQLACATKMGLTGAQSNSSRRDAPACRTSNAPSQEDEVVRIDENLVVVSCAGGCLE